MEMRSALKEQVEHPNNDSLPPHQIKDTQFTGKTGHPSDPTEQPNTLLSA